jgi:hypothetical protein
MDTKPQVAIRLLFLALAKDPEYPAAWCNLALLAPFTHKGCRYTSEACLSHLSVEETERVTGILTKLGKVLK